MCEQAPVGPSLPGTHGVPRGAAWGEAPWSQWTRPSQSSFPGCTWNFFRSLPIFHLR